jgi:hypothetical protein
MRFIDRVQLAGLAAAVLISASALASEDQRQKDFRETGEFKIYAAGMEIGTEKYVILSSGDTITSSSTLDFRNPGERHQKIQLETKMEMNSRFVPRNYLLKSDIEGKKGTIQGEFSPNQAVFSYVAPDGSPRKSGMLVGNEFTLLDTNIFHHFIFLSRLFNYDSKDKAQRFEVIIPQEEDSGFVMISRLGKETLTMRGKKMETHHLQVDSGSLQIHLWVDNQRVLDKISVPDRGIEVLRQQ